MLHRLEARLEHVDVTDRIPSLALRQAYGADIGLAKHGGRDVVVVEVLFGPVGEQVVGDAHAFGDRNRGQLQPIDHVANRVDIGL